MTFALVATSEFIIHKSGYKNDIRSLTIYFIFVYTISRVIEYLIVFMFDFIMNLHAIDSLIIHVHLYFLLLLCDGLFGTCLISSWFVSRSFLVLAIEECPISCFSVLIM